MNSKLLQSFAGALATEFVGRTDLRQTLRQSILKAGPGIQVLALVGKGGIGKTRLERDLLDWIQTQPNLVGPRELIDLYHYVYHIPTELAHKIVGGLTNLNVNNSCFQKYNEQRDEMCLQRIRGFNGGPKSEEVLEAFECAIYEFTQKQRLVIVLDTAERLLYSYEKAACWKWLMKSLPKWGNVTLLLAGRDNCKPLLAELSAEIIEVGKFSEQDSLDYFEAAIRAANHVNARNIAQNIQALPLEMRRQVHEQSQGQPIRLAILVALLSMGAPTTFNAEEETLISELKESGDIGDTIVELGRLPRGATRYLLSEILGLTLEETQERIEAVKGLAFVKCRVEEGEETLFLHDEIYQMLENHVFKSTVNDQPRALEVNQQAIKYYREKLRDGVRQVNLAYDPIEKSAYDLANPPDQRDEEQLKLLTDILGRQHDLIADRVFYQFRTLWRDGFRTYYRYLQIALSAGDLQLFLQLQAEADNALRFCEPNESERELIEGALLMSPVIEAWICGKYPQLLIEAVALRQKYPERFASTSQTGWADGLSIFEAMVRIYRAEKSEEDWDVAEKTLSQIIQKLSAEPEPECELRKLESIHWHRLAILAMAHQEFGFLKLQQWHLRQANTSFTQAIELWRELKIQAMHARVLNDRGHALGLLGQVRDGKILVNDALNMRRKIGRRGPVALSLNTLGIIHRLSGEYDDALTMSWRAYHLASFLETNRPQGLALTALAEAIRRRTTVDLDNYDMEKILKDLRQAGDWAAEAQAIFKQSSQKTNEVRAWIEIGCALRDQVRYIAKESLVTEENRNRMEELAVSSENALRTAHRLAISLYDQADALVNMAWLAHYSNNNPLLDEAVAGVLQTIPTEYQWFNPKAPGDRVKQEEANEANLWQQLGKLYILLGFRELQLFSRLEAQNRDKQSQDNLIAAGYYHAIGLQYSSLYSEHYPPLARARDQMYNAYKALNRSELGDVGTGILRFEGDFKPLLPQKGSAMRQFLEDFALWREAPKPSPYSN